MTAFERSDERIRHLKSETIDLLACSGDVNVMR